VNLPSQILAGALLTEHQGCYMHPC
jgi:hypothetical protein